MGYHERQKKKKNIFASLRWRMLTSQTFWLMVTSEQLDYIWNTLEHIWHTVYWHILSVKLYFIFCFDCLSFCCCFCWGIYSPGEIWWIFCLEQLKSWETLWSNEKHNTIKTISTIPNVGTMCKKTDKHLVFVLAEIGFHLASVISDNHYWKGQNNK